MVFNALRGLLLLLLLLLPIALVVGDLSCKPVSGCRCEGGGFQLDISNLFSYPIMISSGSQSFDLEFSPCVGIQCNGPLTAVCQSYSLTSQNSCGKTNSTVWTVLSLAPLYFVVTYNAGDPVATTNKNRFSIFTFNSTQDQNVRITYITYGGVNNPYYSFIVQGDLKSVVAAQTSDIRGVVGIVLIFIAIGGVAAYFIGGSVYQYYIKGARGQEIVPNINFWKDLPFLIKDGLLFTINPLRRNYEKF